MQKKHRNGRTSTKTSVEDEIAHLPVSISKDFAHAGKAYSNGRRLLI
jgi:hypothetical protein